MSAEPPGPEGQPLRQPAADRSAAWILLLPVLLLLPLLWVFNEDVRRKLRARTRAPKLPANAPDWTALRDHIDEYLRSWSELRRRACLER